MSSGFITQQLLHGLVDIGVTFGEEEDARIRFEHVLDEELVFVTSAQQLEQHNVSDPSSITQISLSDSVRLPLVLPTSTQSLRRILNAYMEQAQVQPKVVVEVNNIHEILALVSAGVGSTILSFAAVSDMLASHQLLALPLQPAMSRSIFVCRSATLPMSIAATKVYEQLRITIASLASTQRWPQSITNHLQPSTYSPL